MMSIKPPLQVLVFRHPKDREVGPYERALIRAFQGGVEAGGYLAIGEDLGIQLQCFDALPLPVAPASEWLDRYCHSLIVVLIDRSFVDESPPEVFAWLADCFDVVRSSGNIHAILPLALDERVGRDFLAKEPRLANMQLLYAPALGESAVRPAKLALTGLHRARAATAAGFPVGAQGLRIFISHAKIDGLPLAQALKYHIEQLGWLNMFYDVEDLPPGCDWRQELERGVGSSLVVMLRTDVYDTRYWCRQEVLWADEYAVPAVLVDGRTELNLPPGLLPYERVPVVRIPDGNLLRILFAALRESLRFACFQRRVESMRNNQIPASTVLRAFSYPPAMQALLRVCRSIASELGDSGARGLILYPDPPLRAGLYEAAESLVARYGKDTTLATPQTLMVTGKTAA